MVTNGIGSSSSVFPESSLYYLEDTLQYLGNPVVNQEQSNDENNEALTEVLKDDLGNGKSFYNELLRFANKQIGNFHSAEDIVSQLYCNLLKKRKEGSLRFMYKVDREKGIDGNPKIRPWIFTCLNNLCIEYRRNKRRRNTIPLSAHETSDSNSEYDGSVGYDIDNKSISPLDILIANEDAEAIRKGVEGLSDKIRQAVVLVYF